MPTQQETFETVYRALLAQGEPSVTRDPKGEVQECCYRGDGGMKCAVGHLISDSDYHGELEGLRASDEFDAYGGTGPAPILRRLGHDVMLCERLQDAHDLALTYDLERWKAYMAGVAAEFGLEVPRV